MRDAFSMPRLTIDGGADSVCCAHARALESERHRRGRPLLIDPSVCDPWDHLVYVEETGEFAARVDPAGGCEDPRGATTLDERCMRLNIEAVAVGRQRVVGTLRREVKGFLGSPRDAMAIQALVAALADLDHPELVVWYLCRDGRAEPPSAALIETAPGLIERILARLDEFAPGVREAVR